MLVENNDECRHTYLLRRVDAEHRSVLFADKYIILHRAEDMSDAVDWQAKSKANLNSNAHVVEVTWEIGRRRNINARLNSDDHAFLQPVECSRSE